LNYNYKLLSKNRKKSFIAKTDKVLRKLKEIKEWAETAMALVQQKIEEMTNRHRDNIILFKIENKVWLDLNKVKTTKIYKKLNTKYIKYTIVEIIGLYTYYLNISPEIHFI